MVDATHTVIDCLGLSSDEQAGQEVFSLLSVSGLPKRQFRMALGWDTGATVICSGPKPSSAHPCHTGPGLHMGAEGMCCIGAAPPVLWQMGHPQPCSPNTRGGAAGCRTPRPWRMLKVSLRAVLHDPLSTFCFCISMISLHSKPGKNKTP